MALRRVFILRAIEERDPVSICAKLYISPARFKARWRAEAAHKDGIKARAATQISGAVICELPNGA